jgi:uncharacterized membrane protein
MWRMAGWLASLPRLARIALTLFIALTAVLVAQPILDTLYLRYFFDFQTRGLPANLAAGVGVIAFIAGWVLLVGHSGEAARPRAAAFWFVLVGVLSFLGMAGYAVASLLNVVAE